MKILSCQLQNFASYKDMDFSFSEQGLTLIQGQTGAGKSTLCDAIPWILFGKTAKDGSADEVLSWPGNTVTYGKLFLLLRDIEFTVYRKRGPKAKDNDLYWEIADSGEENRGKDLNDSQKILNNLLGFDCQTYLNGAYLHEFSQTAQFFITSAKNRRAICEQIADLSLATKLQNKNKELETKLETDYDDVDDRLAKSCQQKEFLERAQETEANKANKWEENHASTLQYVAANFDKFEANREKTISKVCRECGTVLAKPKKIIDKSENPHKERLVALKEETNPHTDAVKDYSNEIEDTNSNIQGLVKARNKIKSKLFDIEALKEILQAFRSIIIQNNIKDIEYNTNKYLTDFFDAEIQVEFDSQENDKLETLLTKDGNVCTYTQLSKGQRQLLKLCFSVAIMQAVANQQGLSFPCLFFDEALSGLDDVMKTKAYRLLENLRQSYDSVFVIDHSEGLKTLFHNVYDVELVNGHSELCQT